MSNIAKLCSLQTSGIKQLPSDEFVLPGCCVGIELEWENFPIDLHEDDDLLTELYQFWNITRDHSLRGNNAWEIRFSNPLAGDNILSSFRVLNSLVEKVGIPSLSRRCSTHVHVDVRDLDFNQFNNFLALYAAVETMLFNWVGENRINNIYCLPMHNIVGDLRAISGLKEETLRMQLADDMYGFGPYKYAALNISAVPQFGSLEFRHMGGCDDFDRLKEWINIIQCIKKYVMENDNIQIKSMPHMISAMGEEQFITRVFGKYAEQLKYVGFESDIRRGVRLSQIFIYNENFIEGSKWIRDRLWDEDDFEEVTKQVPDYWNNRAGLLRYNLQPAFKELLTDMIKE